MLRDIILSDIILLLCIYRTKSVVNNILLHDIEELPVYEQPQQFFTTEEAATALLNSNLKEESICTQIPFSVEINAAFIVDLNKFDSPKDILCDDMGVWSWGGSNKRWISIDKNGFVTFLKSEPSVSGENCFHVWKRYYSLKASPDVKKMILLLEGMYYTVANQVVHAGAVNRHLCTIFLGYTHGWF